jgi:hypothetical protein
MGGELVLIYKPLKCMGDAALKLSCGWLAIAERLKYDGAGPDERNAD